MRKTTIRSADAADDMRRNYRREVRRHELHRKRMTSRIMLAVCVLVVVGVFSALAVHVHAQRALPKTRFEEAAAGQAARAKAPSGAKASAGATKTAETGSPSPLPATTTTPAAKPPAKPAAKPPVASKPPAPAKSRVTAAGLGAAIRTVRIDVASSGFAPAEVTVAAGTSIVLELAAAGSPSLAGFEIPALGIDSDNSAGPVTVHVGSPARGSYRFSSYDGSIEGTLTVR